MPALIRIASVAAAAACALLLPGAAPASRPARADTLVIAIRSDVDALNPYVASDATAFNVLELLYPRLVHERLDPAGPAFTPWLASSWSRSADGTSLTFALRPDARWSDGTPVTCDDVRFTLTAQKSDALAWPGLYLKSELAELRCTDPHTAVFRFTRPAATAMLDANDDAIVPRSYARVPFTDWNAHRWDRDLASCGPYRLKSATPGQELVLERDPSFWSPAKIPRLVFRVYPDAASSVRALTSGEVDLVEKVPPSKAAELAGNAAIQLVSKPSLAYTFIAWNTLDPGAYRAARTARGCAADKPCPETDDDLRRLKQRSPHPILADARVRRALTLATDREDLVRGLWGGRARIGGSPIVSALWAHDPGALLPFDPAAARSLLEAAGWTDTDGDGVREKNGRKLVLEVLADAGNALRLDALQRVTANLALVGVRLVPTPLPRAEFVARARDKNFDGALFGWRAGTRIEPQSVLHSKAAKDRGNNLGAWSTPGSDALLDRAAAAGTDAARPLWKQWQALFRDEQPYTILYEEPLLIGLSARVRNATPSALTPYEGIESWTIAVAP